MNLMIFPIYIMAFVSLFELLTQKEKKLNSQLYTLSFIVVFFIVSIKYYYGPDIHFYVPLYEKIESPLYILKHGSNVAKGTEIGYLYYCSIFKWLGCSFWFLTFSITCLYFYAIHKCFKQLSGFKSTALFALTVLEANVFFFEFRQAISVAFFLLSILSFFEKKYIKYIFLSLLSLTFHKSAFFIVAISTIVLFIPRIKFSRNYYILLLFLLIVGIFISLGDKISTWTVALPIGSSSINSILHHLEVEKDIQVVLLVYFTIFICLYYYSSNVEEKNTRFYILIVSFFLLIAIFYKYWFFLNRVRSYFTPIIIVFVIKELSKKEIKLKVVRQLFVLSFCILAFTYTRGIWLVNKNSNTKILTSTTVFSLKSKTEEQIRTENIKKATLYFQTEYLNNQLK